MRTPQYRGQILDVLKKGHLFTLAEIQKKLPKANHSTLFRNLEQLTDEGIVQKVTLKKNTVAYELDKEHGHFVCNNCNTVSDLNFPTKIIKKGFTVTDMVVRGICKTCK